MSVSINGGPPSIEQLIGVQQLCRRADGAATIKALACTNSTDCCFEQRLSQLPAKGRKHAWINGTLIGYGCVDGWQSWKQSAGAVVGAEHES